MAVRQKVKIWNAQKKQIIHVVEARDGSSDVWVPQYDLSRTRKNALAMAREFRRTNPHLRKCDVRTKKYVRMEDLHV